MKVNYPDLMDTLAAEGKFDEYITPIHYGNVLPVDEHYVYISRNPFFRAFRAVVQAVLYLFAPLVNFFVCGLKVRGRKNLKGVKRAVTVSNHVMMLDYLSLRQAFRNHAYYTTVAPHNSKRGLGGVFMRAGGILPFGATFTAEKNLHIVVKKLLLKKNYVHFYPEQALWPRYEHTRPLKIGAFQFAAHSNVPVLPAFFCFRQRKGLHKLRKEKPAVLIIQQPIYPKPELSTKENAAYLQRETQRAYARCIEEFYGYPAGSETAGLSQE